MQVFQIQVFNLLGMDTIKWSLLYLLPDIFLTVFNKCSDKHLCFDKYATNICQTVDLESHESFSTILLIASDIVSGWS